MKNLFRNLGLGVILAVNLMSCDVDEYMTNEDFTVSVEALPSNIKAGETVEINLEIIPMKEMIYSNYYFMYNQTEGSGDFENSKGRELYPYTTNFFKNKTYTIYYTANSDKRQEVVFNVYNNLGRKEKIIIKFNDQI